MTNDRYNKLVSATKITSAIQSVADEILTDYPTSPLFVALLRGAMPFTSRLMFELVKINHEYHPELDYLTISAYGASHEPKTPKILSSLSTHTIIEGRPVVLLDDVLDNGITSKAARQILLKLGASEVKLAVLVSKDVPTRNTEADYVGLKLANTWLVGMGLDDAQVGIEAYRWSPEIWEIKH